MIDIEKAIELVVQALFTGIGSAVGIYLGNKGLISSIKKIVKKAKR